MPMLANAFCAKRGRAYTTQCWPRALKLMVLWCQSTTLLTYAFHARGIRVPHQPLRLVQDEAKVKCSMLHGGKAPVVVPGPILLQDDLQPQCIHAADCSV